MNPTQDAVEQRIASLEGGVGALLVALPVEPRRPRPSSTSLRQETTSLTSPSLYDGTFNLLKHTLPKFGLEVSFVSDPNDIESYEVRRPPEHQALLRRDDLESKSEVLDIEAVARVAHDNGSPSSWTTRSPRPT